MFSQQKVHNYFQKKILTIESLILRIAFTLKVKKKVLFMMLLQHETLLTSDWDNIELLLSQHIFQA